LLCAAAFAPLAAIAAEGSIESDIQKGFEQSKAIVLTIQNKLQAGVSVSSEIAGLKAAADDIKISNLLMEERFKLREEKVKSLGAKAVDRHEAMAKGYRKALTEYLTLIDNLPSNGTIKQSAVDKLQSLLNKLLPKKHRPIIGSLPYKHLNYPAIEPSTDSAITPAYKGGNKTVDANDTKSTPEAPISKEIAALAQSLNWQPVAIYEHVKNTIETEWYWGCQKGAEETLRQKSGNDCDQALLLSSLLKASGFPTRLVRGNIQFFASDDKPIERIKNLIGIDDPAKMAEFFQKAGIPYKPIIAGGKIANFQIEHIWIESLIPMANYRGAIIDEHGKTWIGLDTSIKVKGYEYNQPQDIFENAALSSQLSAIRDEYLALDLNSQPSTTQPATPLEYLLSSINSELQTQNSPLAYADFLRTRVLIPEVMNILPSSTQFSLIKATNEYTSIPDELVHKVKLSAVSNQPSANADKLFEITLPLYKLSNQQVAISYEPETVQDQEIIDSYGGLDNTPSYLVRLRPVLKINGERIVVATDGLPMGADYTLTMELYSPSVNEGATPAETITNTMITGNLTVIGITAGKAVITPSPLAGEGGGEGEKDAERLLFESAQHYIDRGNQAENELASLFHLSITRPLPTVVTLGGMIDVTYLLDMPHGFTWKGVYVDADLRRIETVRSSESGVQSEKQKLFIQLSSLQGSILENRIFEDDFNVESISTAKLLQLVTRNAQPGTSIITIDKTNIDAILPTLSYDDSIKEDILNSVNQNYTIKIPESEVTHHDWTGIGYIKENLETGESGWMLSGMIAGGCPVDAQWLNQYYQQILNQPYAGPSNNDPLAARFLVKVSSTDKQPPATVGTKLPELLAVFVSDSKGLPVRGATVTFRTIAGGGKLKCLNILGLPTDTPADQCTSRPTNKSGIAKVQLILGKKTGDNPIYQILNTTDENYSQLGLNLITASVQSNLSEISLAEPIEAYGKPDIRDRIVKVYGEGTTAVVNNPAGSLAVKVVDQYDNPISNVTVKFASATAESLEPAVTLPTAEQGLRNIQFYRSEECNLPHPDKHIPYPLYGDCKTYYTEIDTKTEYFGAIVNAVLGNTVNTKYTVKATAMGIPSAEFTLKSTGYRDTNERYLPSGIYMGYLTIVNDKGQPVNAARAGEELKAPLMSEFYQYTDDFTTEGPSLCEINNQWTNCWKIKPKGTITMKKVENGTVAFNPTQGGGTSAGTQNLGHGLYGTHYTTGAAPAVNKIKAEGKATIAVPEVYYYSSTDEYLATSLMPTTRSITLNSGQSALFNSDTNATIYLPTPDAKQTLEYVVYGVDVPLTVEPGLILVNDDGQTTTDTTLKYTILPPEYNAVIADVDIYKTDANNADEWLGYIPGDKTQGQGSVGYVKGSNFDINTHYKAQVVLNRGTDAEIKGRNERNNDNDGNDNSICEQDEACVDKVTIPVGQLKLWTDEAQPTEVIGAVTDDITTIKLALSVKYGREDLSPLTWTIADSQVLNASQEIQGTLLNGNNPAPSRPVSFNSEGIATVRYEVPTTFVRYGTSPEIEEQDRNLPEREVLIKLNGSTLGLPTIKLKRPPLVLVHGTWGTPKGTWNEFKPIAIGDGDKYFVTRADYSSGDYSNVGSLEQNYPAIQDAIDMAMDAVIAKGIAATKVDVLTHSLGGLVVREYCRRETATCSNTIRKIITMDAPHLGTELADVWVANRSTIGFIARVRRLFNMDPIDGDALDVQRVNSTELQSLAAFDLPVPLHKIVGKTPDQKYGYVLLTKGLWAILGKYFNLVPDQSFPLLEQITQFDPNGFPYVVAERNYSALFSSIGDFDAGRNDRIVSIHSQKDGNSINTTVIENVDHVTIHEEAPSITKCINALLDARETDTIWISGCTP
jgi:pimeloyl-ACP methyl ester carboxylesterase